jgi:hypothetical protein
LFFKLFFRVKYWGGDTRPFSGLRAFVYLDLTWASQPVLRTSLVFFLVLLGPLVTAQNLTTGGGVASKREALSSNPNSISRGGKKKLKY